MWPLPQPLLLPSFADKFNPNRALNPTDVKLYGHKNPRTLPPNRALDPNQALDRKSVAAHGKDNFLSAFVFS